MARDLKKVPYNGPIDPPIFIIRIFDNVLSPCVRSPGLARSSSRQRVKPLFMLMP